MIKFQKHVATTDPNTRSPASIQCDEILKGQDGGDDDEFMNEQDQELDIQKKPGNDMMQKNFKALEEMKQKREQEAQQIERQREKTRKKQEKLKNIILKEAEEYREKKKKQKEESNEVNV